MTVQATNPDQPGHTGLGARLASAFADVDYPGDDKIACGAWGYDVETAGEITAAFRGRHWKDILQLDSEWFRRNYDVLMRLTPEAYVFYIPAFLLKVIDNVEDLDLLPEWIVYSIEPPPKYLSDLERWHRSMKGRLTAVQRAALIESLDFLNSTFSDSPQLAEHIRRAKQALFSTSTKR